jgi:hypothetical protein
MYKSKRQEGTSSHQGQQMSDIYSQAEQVIFWLGPSTADVDSVLSALQHFEWRLRMDYSNKWYRNSSLQKKLWKQSRLYAEEGAVLHRYCHGLVDLLRRPWFNRVWILQEVANAKRAIICSGSKVVSSQVSVIAPKLVGVTPDPHCQAVLDIMPGYLRSYSWWNFGRDLYTLLLRFRESQASDP